jgi:hypothetical protein
MVAEQKRSYYLPKKLIDAVDKGCRQAGLVRQRATAAAMLNFLQASPQERQEMFDRLNRFLSGKGS